MHISSSIFTLFGAAVFMTSKVIAASSQDPVYSVASNFNHLNPSRSIMQIQKGSLQPVAYVQTGFLQRTLYDGHRFDKIRSGKSRKNNKSRLSRKKHHGKKNKKRKSKHHKRSNADTLKYLRAAIDSYRKDSVTPPPVQLMQLEQQIAPQTPQVQQTPVNTPPTPPPTEEVEATAVPDLENPNPPLPDLSAPQSTAAELGNESSESAPVPVSMDIEDEDLPDPEEDPDDYDGFPVVNGVPVQREE